MKGAKECTRNNNEEWKREGRVGRPRREKITDAPKKGRRVEGMNGSKEEKAWNDRAKEREIEVSAMNHGTGAEALRAL